MVASATVRILSAEEIAARAGGETPYLHLPQRNTLFAERQMRLLQLSRGHAMGDFLAFVADLARVQQAQLSSFAAVPVPDAEALDRAARQGLPPLSAVDWPRDPAWREALRRMVAELQRSAPAGVQPALQRLAAADAAHLEQQADALLSGEMKGLDLATAPVVAAALQAYWTHMVLEVQALQADGGQPFGRLDDPTICPCCGSRPTASITRSEGTSLGQRYLHCSLCSLQWHMVRIKCTHCLSEKSLAYQSLDSASAAADEEGAARRAAQATVQAETCDDCGHYLKIVHTDRDPFVDPVADDLASLTLDLLVSQEDQGPARVRHGVNLMLLFGEPGPPPPPEREA
jgi:FdhE protein